MSDRFYLNTRLRWMRAQLLSRRDVERILALADLPAIAATLREGPYRRWIDSAGSEGSEADRIEEGLRRNVSETLSRLLDIASGDCAEAVRLVLERWEVQAIKTVLRGKAGGASPGEILSALVPTGIHDESALSEMCRQPDVRAVVELLVTWREPWGRPLLRALNGYRGTADLFRLESALDRSWSLRAAERLREILPSFQASEGEDPLSRFVSLTVDTSNLMTALKMVEERIPPGDRESGFLPGGRVFDRDAFDRISASPNLAEALGKAKRSSFRQPLAALAADPGSTPLPVIERQLDRVLLRESRALSRIDPLGWGPLVSYLQDKLREVRNLRMIVRARIADLPETELGRLLVLDG